MMSKNVDTIFSLTNFLVFITIATIIIVLLFVLITIKTFLFWIELILYPHYTLAYILITLRIIAIKTILIKISVGGNG